MKIFAVKRSAARYMFMGLILMLMLLPISCSDSGTDQTGKVTGEDVKKEATQAAGAAAAYADQTREEYAAKMKETLNNFEQQIEELKAEVQKKGDAASAELKADLQTLEQKKDELAKDVSELTEKGKEEWRELKAATDVAWSELEKAYQRTKEKLNKESSGG